MGYQGSGLLGCHGDGVLMCWALICQALEVLGRSAIVLRCQGARVLGCPGVGVLSSCLRNFSLPDHERQLSVAVSLSSNPQPGTRQINHQQMAPVCPCAGEGSGGSKGCTITSG